jgi:hypothetical protein
MTRTSLTELREASAVRVDLTTGTYETTPPSTAAA